MFDANYIKWEENHDKINLVTSNEYLIYTSQINNFSFVYLTIVFYRKDVVWHKTTHNVLYQIGLDLNCCIYQLNLDPKQN